MIKKFWIKHTNISMIFLFFLNLGYSQPNPRNSRGDTLLRIMSYNIHIASPPSTKPEFTYTDLEAVADAINRVSPDIVAIQEVDQFTQRSGKDSDQARDLGFLTDMYSNFSGAVDRSDGVQGVATLSRFKIINTHNVKLPVPKGAKGETRSMAVSFFRFQNHEMVFVSVHLDYLADSTKAFQIKKMVRELQQFQDFPIILAGDLNSEPGNLVVKLLRNNGFNNQVKQPLTFPSVHPKVSIDYILLNNKANEFFKVKDFFTVDEKYASDHLPLVMDLILR